MRMPMKYIVDIHNTANTASLQNFLQNKIDLSNNFFPGIDKQIGGKVRTYYPKAPYMLSANTAWLVPNTTKKPLDDRVFRRALATVDQHRPDRQGRLREHRRRRRIRPACCRRGASGSTRRSPRSSASPTTSRGRRRSWRAPATRTPTVTASSRTRTGRRSTCGSSSRTGGRTGRPRSRSSPTARRPPASSSRRRTPTSTGWSRSATPASSTS